MGNQHASTSSQPQSFRTADLEVARAQVAKTFAEHDMSASDGRDLNFHLDLAPCTRITLGLLSYGTDVRIAGPPMRSMYHVNLPVAGGSIAKQGGRTSTSQAGRAGMALLPNDPLNVRWSPDGVQYAIKFPKELLEAHAAKLAGHPVNDVLRFSLEFDLTTGQAQAFLATVGFLYAELSRPGGLVTMPAARQELEAAVMTQLVMTVPSQLTPYLQHTPSRARRSKIRQVMEYIDEHPGADLDTAELASVAGISVRALQAGFRELIGMSPRDYVRGVRLDRVHWELSVEAPGSVTEIAGRWGFFHPGHFARQYRERFGELPSETARR